MSGTYCTLKNLSNTIILINESAENMEEWEFQNLMTCSDVSY